MQPLPLACYKEVRQTLLTQVGLVVYSWWTYITSYRASYRLPQRDLLHAGAHDATDTTDFLSGGSLL